MVELVAAPAWLAGVGRVAAALWVGDAMGRLFRGRGGDRLKRKVGAIVWDKVKDKLLAALVAGIAAFVAALLGTQANPPAVKIDAPPGVTVQVVR